MTKHKKTRRSQKGGDWFGTSQYSSAYPQNSYSQGPYPKKSSWFDFSSWFSDSNQPGYGQPGYGQSSYSNPSSSYSSSYGRPSSYGQPGYGQPSPYGQPYSNQPSGNSIFGWGGKGRNKTLKMKGGKMPELSGAPVDGLNVAKPTYYLKNGGKRGKSQRRKNIK